MSLNSLTPDPLSVLAGYPFQGDMRSFSFEEKFDAAIITGQSIAYMISNNDMLSVLRSVRDKLKPGVLLAFDCFNAPAIFKDFTGELSQQAEFECRHYRWDSRKPMCMEAGWTWNWYSKY